jgi:Zn-dependent protease with chaperone function
MNFFSSQDRARRKTGHLVVLFCLAVGSLVVMTNLLVMAVFGYIEAGDPESGNFLSQLDLEVFSMVGLGVIAVVLIGSLYKLMALSGGGARIAEMLGAELIVDGSGDVNRQKILNVVEEMAIASGTPVPPVYLMNEEGINAFAAGYSPSDAVIGVTRGTIEKLSRDELQGVIAHEFSHILNGDMRLNIRLIGTLHGILVIGLIGYHIIRGASHSRGSKKEGGGAILFLGLGLMVIGYAGTFFGNLIKAAVSRQREFLADASAVQFTRNPGGIAGALKRIGGSEVGSVLESSESSEISHALFSQGFTSFFSGLFATHPPLDERIRQIEPNWDGEFVAPLSKQESVSEEAKGDDGGQKRKAATLAAVAAATIGETAVRSVGQPTAEHLGHARELIEGLPAGIKDAAHQPFTARAVIHFLVLDDDPRVRSRQLKHLKDAADRQVYEETARLVEQVGELKVEQRLPLVDMVLPALRQLSKEQYLVFRENLDTLIEADGRLSLFEWVLRKIICHHLDAVYGIRSRTMYGYTNMARSGNACSVLLSLLIHASSHNGMSKEEVFAL